MSDTRTQPTLSVGDLVALYSGHIGLTIPQVRRVVSITPSGRIKLEGGTVLNPDLSIRGDQLWSRCHATIADPALLDTIEQARKLNAVRNFSNWESLPTEVIASLAAVMYPGRSFRPWDQPANPAEQSDKPE